MTLPVQRNRRQNRIQEMKKYISKAMDTLNSDLTLQVSSVSSGFPGIRRTYPATGPYCNHGFLALSVEQSLVKLDDELLEITADQVMVGKVKNVKREEE